VFHRILVSFISTLLGAAIMAITYDVKLISIGEGFTNQAGLDPTTSMLIKIVFAGALLITTIILVVKEPLTQENELNDGP